MRQKAKHTKEAIAKTSFMHYETSGIIGRPFTLLKKPIIKNGRNIHDRWNDSRLPNCFNGSMYANTANKQLNINNCPPHPLYCTTILPTSLLIINRKIIYQVIRLIKYQPEFSGFSKGMILP